MIGWHNVMHIQQHYSCTRYIFRLRKIHLDGHISQPITSVIQILSPARVGSYLRKLYVFDSVLQPFYLSVYGNMMKFRIGLFLITECKFMRYQSNKRTDIFYDFFYYVCLTSQTQIYWLRSTSPCGYHLKCYYIPCV